MSDEYGQETATEELDGMVAIAEDENELETEEYQPEDIIGEVVQDEEAEPPIRSQLDLGVKEAVKEKIEAMKPKSSLTFKPEMRKYINAVAPKIRKATGKKYPTQTKKNAAGEEVGVQIWNM
jgi:DNA polymerase II small subunit/DNA polymerase delta subunit B